MCRITHSQRGCTLPEALAAVFVISVGLPGLGLLQLESLRTLQEAGWQLAAVMVATDAAESLRAGTPASGLTAAGLPGLPPAARLSVTTGAGTSGTDTQLRVDWPGHDGVPGSFELESGQ